MSTPQAPDPNNLKIYVAYSEGSNTDIKLLDIKVFELYLIEIYAIPALTINTNFHCSLTIPSGEQGVPPTFATSEITPEYYSKIYFYLFISGDVVVGCGLFLFILHLLQP